MRVIKKKRSRRRSKSSDESNTKSKKSKYEDKRDIEFLPSPKQNDFFVGSMKLKWSIFIQKFKQHRNNHEEGESDEDGGILEFLPDEKPKSLLRLIKIKCFELINSFIPSKNQLNDRRLQNRMKMCILAVCLMWATSLRVAVYIASHAIKVPQMQMLYESCKNTFEIANEEKNRYDQCVDVQLEQCKSDLHRSIVAEALRVTQSSTFNTDKVNYAKKLFENCTSDYNDLRFALEGWVDSGQSLPLNHGNCSESEREKIMSDVGDINLVHNQAMSITEEYIQHSQTTVQRIATYATLRADYDANYLDNHTKDMQEVVEHFVRGLRSTVPELDFGDLTDTLYESIDEAMSCVSPRSAIKGICKTGKGVRELIADAYVAWGDLEEAYVQRVNGLHERYAKYKQNVQRAYEISSGFYHLVQNSILTDPMFSWMWGDKFALDVSTFLPAEVPYPEIADFYALYDKIPKIDTFYPNVEPAFEKFMTKVNETVYGLSMSAKVFREEIKYGLLNAKDIPNLLPEDYDPPEYIGSNIQINDLQAEKELHANISESFISRSTSALNEFSKFTKNFTSTAREIDIPKVNISSVKTQMSNVDLRFEGMTKPSVRFDLWFFKFASVSDMLFLLDFVVRSYFSIRLFFKYWDAGSIKLPEVDVRVHKEIKNPFKMSNGRLVILLFTNPLIGACMFALVVAGVLTFASSVYTPLYKEYINGCVPSTGNGTFTTANIYSTAYNFAYQKGSSSLVKGLEVFDEERASKCSKLYTTSVTKQNEDELQMQSYSKSLEATNDQMDLLVKCIDSDMAKKQFQSVCCGEIGYDACEDSVSKEYPCPMNTMFEPPIPYNSPGDYLSKNSCGDFSDEKLWDLVDATFECDSLPSCQVTCIGPQKEKLHQASKECGCIIEWFAHSIWLKGVITLMVFASLNASRVGFIDGLSRYLWKSLHPGSFSVWATCDQKGKFLAKSFHAGSLTNKGQEPPRHTIRLNGEIRKQIERNSFTFRTGGAVIMIVAMLLNIPWIIVVIRSPDASRPKWLL